jgi:uncharacterized Zn finger protein (UPF0148 family)
MSDNCPYCGTRLVETNWGRKWCPNCGMVEEEKEENKYIQYDSEKYRGYVK